MVFLTTPHTSSFISPPLLLFLGDGISSLLAPLPSFFFWQGYSAIQRPLLSSVLLLPLWFLMAVMSGCHIHLDQLLSPLSRLVAEALVVSHGLAKVVGYAAKDDAHEL